VSVLAGEKEESRVVLGDFLEVVEDGVGTYERVDESRAGKHKELKTFSTIDYLSDLGDDFGLHVGKVLELVLELGFVHLGLYLDEPVPFAPLIDDLYGQVKQINMKKLYSMSLQAGKKQFEFLCNGILQLRVIGKDEKRDFVADTFLVEKLLTGQYFFKVGKPFGYLPGGWYLCWSRIHADK